MNLQQIPKLSSAIPQCVRRIFILPIAAMALAGVASAATIGVDFMTGANNGNTNGALLLPTDVAGASTYAQDNWNCVAAALGTNVALLDSAGAATTVAISWSSPNTWSQSGNTTASQGTADANLMNPYLDNNGNANVAITNPFSMFSTTTPPNANRNWPLVYLTGLNAWMAAQGVAAYDVVIYSDGDNAGGRTGEYWAVNASGTPDNLTLGVDASTHVFICDLNNFIANPVYTQVPLFVQSGAISGGIWAEYGNFPGNYTVLQSLTNDTVLFRTQRFNSRAPINAIQIIPRASLLPATFAGLYDAPVYAGRTARFAPQVAGATPMTFQWRKNGSNLTDGGNIAGSSSQTLTVSSVSAGDGGSYSLVVSNSLGVVASSSAVLTIVAPVPNSYPEKIATNIPYAYWRFNETADPSSGYTPAYDFAGGFTATYGILAQNGFNTIVGPQPPDWPGFESGNAGYLSSRGGRQTYLIAPPLNLNTNTVTMCAWIYPTAAQGGFTGLLSSRNGNDVGALGYGNNNMLGYTWNSNSASTYNFVSGLVPPSNTWSFVALTISPTNAVLYLYNTNGQTSATNAIAHTIEGMTGPTYLGGDPQGASIAAPQGRSFVGTIDEVAIFNRTLPQGEIYNLYKKSLGLNYLPAIVSTEPVSLTLYTNRSASFTVTASGDPTISYQWRRNGSNLSNGGNISGATSPTLSVANVSTSDAGSYDCVVANLNAATSAVAILTVVVPSAPPPNYESVLQTLNPLHYWRFNEPASSLFAYDYWGGNIATNDNVTTGSAGPQPPDFPGFENSNAANSYDGLSSATETGLVGVNNNQTNFTIAGWFNAAGTIGLRVGLFGQNDTTEYGFHGQDPAISGTAGLLGIWTPGGGAAYLSQTNITPGQWYFTAAVGNGASLNLYLFTTNGSGGFQVAQSTTTAVTTNYGASPFPFNIGGGGILDATDNYFTGLIDEVALWHRALSVGELSTLFATGIGVSALAPEITAQPSGLTLYSGRTATLSVSVVGTTPLSYQWLKNDGPIPDANAAGISTATLTITNIAAANIGDYKVIITNSVGSVTSSVASLGVITPPTGGYEATVIGMNPLAYYRLNETTDPATGTAVDNDYWGGFSGLYGVGASNGFNNIAGPRPPGFTFEANNYALETGAGILSSWATAPFGSLSANTVTMCMWVMPTGTFDTFAGLLVNRNSGVAGGFGYTGGQLGYTWNNNSANTYNFRSGLVPPLNEWSFVAMVVTPTNAIIYMFNTHGELSATNVLAHTSDVFGNNWRIGKDDNANANDGSRNFTGLIDEVAVFTRSLTGAQLRQLYVAGSVGIPNTLTVQQSGGNIILTWPYGMLIQAPTVTGPWSPVPGNPTSPYSTAPTGAMQFYRVQVQ
jgi:hypothetical protein